MARRKTLYDQPEVWGHATGTGQRNLVQAIADCWPRGVKSALDVGCGDGALTAMAAKLTGTEIVALDRSAQALSRTKLKKLCGDIVSLPFRDHSFDLVMCTDVLEHLDADTENRAWREIFRVARSHVMVAVPHAEYLQEGMARCRKCGRPFHVNWHRRSYDLPTLIERVPSRWKIAAAVLTGERWNGPIYEDTLLRHELLEEGAYWDKAVCPHCGGRAAPNSARSLPDSWSAVIAQKYYRRSFARLPGRNHSEILLIVSRGRWRQPLGRRLPKPRLAVKPMYELDCRSDGDTLHDFVAYPRVPRHFITQADELYLQFPVYDAISSAVVEGAEEAGLARTVVIQDAGGILHNELLPAVRTANLVLRDRVIPGRFGLTLRIAPASGVHKVRLKAAEREYPRVKLASGQSLAYLPVEAQRQSLFVQCVDGEVPGAEDLAPMKSWIPKLDYDARAFAVDLQKFAARLAERSQGFLAQLESSQAARHALTDAARERNRLEVTVQNLTTEREALLRRAKEADRLEVENQNLATERKALLQRAKAADRLEVENQNLATEREALLQRAKDADRLEVENQNLATERKALLRRAKDADRLEVENYNLAAERKALLQRAKDADRLEVENQNLATEREALLQRAKEGDSLAVENQNLRVEREALSAQAREAEQLTVDRQNLTAERDALLLRAKEADGLAVDKQNLIAERDALLLRAKEADRLAVENQNLAAELDALRQGAVSKRRADR